MIQIRRQAIVRQTPERMFDLVNDVEAYPRRFAWCADAAVLAREGEHALTARLDLRFAGAWRQGHPRLVAWLDDFAAKVPAFEATKPH